MQSRESGLHNNITTLIISHLRPARLWSGPPGPRGPRTGSCHRRRVVYTSHSRNSSSSNSSSRWTVYSTEPDPAGGNTHREEQGSASWQEEVILDLLRRPAEDTIICRSCLKPTEMTCTYLKPPLGHKEVVFDAFLSKLLGHIQAHGAVLVVNLPLGLII